MMNPLIESLPTLAEQAALSLLVWSWQALVLLVCVWAALKLFRVKTPALRQHIRLISLLVVLTLPIWPRLAPKPTSTQEQHLNDSALSYAAEAPRLIFTPAPEAGLPVAHYKSVTVAPKKNWQSKILQGIFCFWIAGAFFVLVRSVRSYTRLRKARRHALPTTPAELGSALELPRSVSLGLSADVCSPALFGLRRPMILAPYDLAEWTSVEERDAMIAHELAHLAKLDHFTNLVILAVNIIFFFHPLVRYACRQFRLEREMACDDHLIAHGVDATMYAESLVKAAERSVKGKLDDFASYSLSHSAFFTSKQDLERRIEMILNTDRVRALARQWRYLVLPAALILTLAWMLAPSRPATAQQLQKQFDNAAEPVKADIDNEPKLNELNLQQLEWMATNHENADTRQEAQKWLATRRGQAGARGRNVKDAPPPPPPPPTPAPQPLKSAAALVKTLQGAANDVKIVKALLRESNEAFIKRDLEFYERTLADDFQAIGPDGKVSSKGQTIIDTKHAKIKLTKIEIDDLRIKGEGNSMVATFLNTYYYDENGNEKMTQTRETINCIKRQGRWQFVGWHYSPVR
jgi:beta-lactamase regulating signal transducer with metallopeptidase domain